MDGWPGGPGGRVARELRYPRFIPILSGMKSAQRTWLTG